MDELDQRLKRYYGEQEADPEKVKALQEQLAAAPDPEKRTRFIFSLAATFLFLCLVGIGWLAWQGRPARQISNYAAEIALNHKKQLSPEFFGSAYAEIGAQMPKLDFAVVQPASMDADLILKGGRYCSVDNHIAAQFRLKNKAGESFTLYQFKDPDFFPPVDKEPLVVDGVEVRIWKQGDTVLGLASSQ